MVTRFVNFTVDELDHQIIHGTPMLLKHGSVLVTATQQCLVNNAESVQGTV